MWVASLHRFTILIKYNNLARSFSKLLNIIAHAYYTAANSRSFSSSVELALVVGSSTKVDETILFAILAEEGSNAIGQWAPPLKLSAPESTEVAVNLTIVILEHTRVDRERTTNRLIHGLEWTFGLVGYGNTETEYAIISLSREDEIVLAIFLNNIIIPHLLLSPCHILHVENYSVIGSLIILYIVERQYMVVFHLEVTTIIVEGSTSFPVVRGIDIETTVKYVG